METLDNRVFTLTLRETQSIQRNQDSEAQPRRRSNN